MTLFSKRLPHVVTRKDLALIVAPTYAAAAEVEFDEALERMERAVGTQAIVDALYDGLSRALGEIKGPRTTEDEVIDALSKGMQKRRSRVKPAEVTPAISAVLVMLNLELGYAPEMMRGTLASPKGAQMLQQGLRELGSHLFGQLVK
jgi:hypothetical protein